MWPYNDDESLWLDKETAEARLIPQDQINPDLIAYYERRARKLRAEAIAGAAGDLYNALRRPFREKSLNVQQRWIGARPRSGTR